MYANEIKKIIKIISAAAELNAIAKHMKIDQ